MSFFKELPRNLFKLRLLPARYEENLHYDVRRTGIFGLFSYFEGIDPGFAKYLEKKGVKYRTKSTSGYSGKILFWTKADHDICVEAQKTPWFYANDDFQIELIARGMPFTRKHIVSNLFRYQVFSPDSIVVLMLYYQSTVDEYGDRTFKRSAP